MVSVSVLLDSLHKAFDTRSVCLCAWAGHTLRYITPCEICVLHKWARSLKPIKKGEPFCLSLFAFFANYTEASKGIIHAPNDPCAISIEPDGADTALWNDGIILESGIRTWSLQSAIVLHIITRETYRWQSRTIIVSWSKWNYYGVFASALQGILCLRAPFQRHRFPTGLN